MKEYRKIGTGSAPGSLRPKIACALGGGGAPGLAHIGVLKVLESKGINPDIIVGTSIGAFIGALYASGLPAPEIEQLAIHVDWKKLRLFVDPAFSMHGIIQGKRIMALFRSIIGDLTFDQLVKDFTCIATDIQSGEPVLLRQGPLVPAVRASISIPGVFVPVKINGRHLVDGGLVTQVPVKVCRELGAEFIIAVNVIPDPKDTPLGRITNDRKYFRNAPSLLEVLIQSFTIMGYRLAVEDIRQADLTINPDVGAIGFWQYDRAGVAIAAGEAAARTALSEDRRFLSYLSPG